MEVRSNPQGLHTTPVVTDNITVQVLYPGLETQISNTVIPEVADLVFSLDTVKTVRPAVVKDCQDPAAATLSPNTISEDSGAGIDCPMLSGRICVHAIGAQGAVSSIAGIVSPDGRRQRSSNSILARVDENVHLKDCDLGDERNKALEDMYCRLPEFIPVDRRLVSLLIILFSDVHIKVDPHYVDLNFTMSY